MFAGLPVLLIGCLTAWSCSSPRLSFMVIGLAFSRGVSGIAPLFVDESSLIAGLADEMSPLLAGAAQSENMPPQVKAARRIMATTLARTLPLVLKSSKAVAGSLGQSTDKDSALRGKLLPILLNINPAVWDEWIANVTAGKINWGQCRYADKRAACQLTIHGPGQQSAQIALLWERQTVYWRLKGVSGIRELVQAMR